jgi:hypothetical protein
MTVPDSVPVPIASLDDLPYGFWCGACGARLDGFHGDALIQTPDGSAIYGAWVSQRRSVAVIGHGAPSVRIHTEYGFDHDCTQSGSFPTDGQQA